MDLFLDESDFIFFWQTLKKYKGETGTEIFAYCLMNNHVHLLLRTDNDNLPLFLKKTEVRFSNYFNGKYEHVGHVFQNRYRSECINDQHYFISALRYIIRNPQQAGICHWSDYPWSSAQDYQSNNSRGVTDLQFAYDILGGQQSVEKLFDAPVDCRLAEPTEKKRVLSDTEASRILNKVAEDFNMNLTVERSNEEMQDFVKAVMKSGITIRQIQRITGISRSRIQRIKNINPARK